MFEKGNPGGPGRPRNADKNRGAVAKAEARIRDKLPLLIDNMLHLAMGGYERVEEQYAPAGSLWIGQGKDATLMYPDKDPDELVMVKRTVSVADKDRKANEYLIDRIMGKPVQQQEIIGELSIVKGYTTDANPDDWDTPEPETTPA